MQQAPLDPRSPVERDGPEGDEYGSEYHARVKRMFEEARDTTERARKERELDIDYYHNIQWTEEEVKELRKRKQPVITYNLIRSKIETICGVEEGSRTSPKAWPRTPQDASAADVATDVLRYVTDLNRFDKTRIDVLRDMLVTGTGGAIVEVEQKPGRFEIKIRKLRWEFIVYDPFSREADFSDARYLGGAVWMNEADAIALYGEAAREAVESAIQDAGLSRGGYTIDSYADRPLWTWADVKRRRVLVVELYHKERGAWHHCVFTGGGVIRQGPSAYLDADGAPSCPIELVSTYINRDNERYGLVFDMRGPQDEINHRRSKALHLLNTKQSFRKEGTIASKDPQHLRKQLNKADGDVELSRNAVWGQDVGVIDNTRDLQGQVEFMRDAMAFIDRLGPNAGLSGRGTEDQSGRAILAQQQAGMAELGTIFAAHNDWMLRIYRQVWARARQFWTAPMYVRVTDELDSAKFVMVNEPVGEKPQIDPQGMPVIDPQTMQPVMEPVMRNRLAEMGVDLIVDRVPLVANLQSEEFKTLADLAKNGLPIPPKALIMASQIRDKQMVLDAMEEAMNGPPPDPAMQDMAQRKGAAEIAYDEARAAKAAADARKVEMEAAMLGAPPPGVFPPQPPGAPMGAGGAPPGMPGMPPGMEGMAPPGMGGPPGAAPGAPPMDGEGPLPPGLTPPGL